MADATGANGAGSDAADDHERRMAERRHRRRQAASKRARRPARRSSHHDYSDASITSTRPFVALVALLALALSIQFLIVFSWHHRRHDAAVLGRVAGDGRRQIALEEAAGEAAFLDENPLLAMGGAANPGLVRDPTKAHLVPHLPPLPPVLNTRGIQNADALVAGTLSGDHPTIAGVSLILDRFLTAMHGSNAELASRKPPNRAKRDDVHEAFARIAREHLAPLDAAYRGRSMFPIRDDGSIFLSLASFRDHLLGDTLKGAFDQARNPDRLFIGAIVQNCLGLDPYPGEPGVQCRTGAQVVGKGPNGRDQTKVSDAPPDRNGIEEFCTSPGHKKYCDAGQVRALYLHENESLGPSMARYYASKLWGGETYFVQVDSHLEFYKHWDQLYTDEARATRSYPKSVLSSYPPGFQVEHGGRLDHESPGARLCTCEFSSSDVEAQIIRINTGAGYRGDEPRPTRIPFIAAGFFFARAEFLVDVPFDPWLPWTFMGEEIMLSMRAYTSGWDVYAPRKNWIAHQYRPGRMGLPKFWGSVGRVFGRPGPGFSNALQLKIIKRVKHLVGYKDCCTEEKLREDGEETVLEEVEHYGFGNVRTREEYLDWAAIDVDGRRCRNIKWCNQGELE